MAAESELIESIDKITDASRRSRPFMLLGLLGIVAGFVFLVIYLDRLRNEAEADARQWKAEAVALKATLHDAEVAMRNRRFEQAYGLINAALNQAGQLVIVAEQAGTGSGEMRAPEVRRPAPAPRNPPARAPRNPPAPAAQNVPVTQTPGPPAPAQIQPTAPVRRAPRGVVLVNRTRQTIGCGSRASLRHAIDTEQEWQPAISIPPGAEVSVAPGSYVCGVGRARQQYDFGIDDARRYILTLASDGTVAAAASGPE